MGFNSGFKGLMIESWSLLLQGRTANISTLDHVQVVPPKRRWFLLHKVFFVTLNDTVSFGVLWFHNYCSLFWIAIERSAVRCQILETGRQWGLRRRDTRDSIVNWSARTRAGSCWSLVGDWTTSPFNENVFGVSWQECRNFCVTSCLCFPPDVSLAADLTADCN